MLLLSSATRIFATKRPPAILHLRQPHPRCTTPMGMACLGLIGAFADVRVNRLGVMVCRKSILAYSAHCRPSVSLMQQRAQLSLPCPRPHFSNVLAKMNYQGMIFFKPFFFLLLDSFLVSFLSTGLPVCGSACAVCAASGFAPSEV